MGYYFVIGISGLIIGFLVGLLVRRKPTSSASPAVNPSPSGDLIKEVIETEVDRGIELHELDKKADKVVEDINKYLEEEAP